jgi:acyl-CoA synthetase (AMP-forming)/AMP-acid ligase II/acyl carrier protein
MRGPPEVLNVAHPYLDLGTGEPDRPSLLAPGRVGLSRGELRAQVDRVAAALVERGVRPGDAIGIVGPNGPELAIGFLAVSSVAAAAPINPALRPAELAYEIADLHMRAVVLTGPPHPVEEEAARARVAVLRLEPVVAGAAVEVVVSGPDLGPRPSDDGSRPALDPDVAILLHTSGTTARPKIVPLTGANLAASAAAVAAALELSPDDVGLEVMPLFHVHGLVAGLLAGLHAGGAVVCTVGFHAPDAAAWWPSADSSAPTWMTAVPTMHQSLAERLRSHPSEAPPRPLRLLRSSSAALAPSVLEAVESVFGAPLVEAYGMTEAAHQIASNPPSTDRRPGTVGRPAGAEVAVRGDADAWAATGEVGEVVIRGPGVTSGYLTREEQLNRDAFVDGWFRTGDLGRVDADGYLTLTGRSKELINRGGEKVSPREVDEVLLAHPGVSQAVAFAVPDPRLGEEVAAAVVVDGTAAPTERELRMFASTRLAAHKVPRRVVVVDQLPKGPTGKLVRAGLAGRLGLDHPAGIDGATRALVDHVEPRNDLERFVADLWREVLGLDGDPGVHEHFLDLGGDSMAASRLLAAVRDRLDLEVSMLDLYDLPTVAEQADLVEQLLLAADAG